MRARSGVTPPSVARLRAAAVATLLALATACGTTAEPPPASLGDTGLPAPASSDGLGGVTSRVRGAAVPLGSSDVGTTATTRDGTGQVNAPAGATAAPVPGGGPVADRRPIKIGMIYTYNDDAAAAAGVDNGNTFTSKATFDAMVKAYNARGGVAGRRIVAVAVELSSNSTSLSSDLQAACDNFTQDEHVAVVFSAIGLFSEAFSACLAKAGTPQITGDYSMGDARSVAAVRTLLGVTTLTVDDRETALLTHMTSVRRITRADKLGVVVEGCPYNRRAYTSTVEPLAKRLGVPVVETLESRCFEDIGDLGGLGSDMQNAVLRFQTRGITHVVFVSGSVEGNAMFLFATAAETQGYHPTYLLTSAAAAAVQEANTPKAQLANAYGVGWIPALDVGHSPLTGAAAKRCLQDLHSTSGIMPQSAVDRYYAASTCDVFAMYDAVLRADRGASDARSVMAAVGGLGTGFAAAASFGESTDFRGGRRTGAAQARQFAWTAACGCFDYTGPPFSLLAR
jgi:hypothetical protein